MYYSRCNVYPYLRVCFASTIKIQASCCLIQQHVCINNELQNDKKKKLFAV